MTSFFSDLEDQLRAAANEQAAAHGAPVPPPGEPPRRGRWLARGARTVPILAAVGVTLAVVVGALVLLGHRGAMTTPSPPVHTPAHELGSIFRTTPQPRLKQEFGYIGKATQSVLASSACREPGPSMARTIHAKPGAALLATLGLLRRPATAADRLASPMLGATGPGTAAYVGAARRAVSVGRSDYFLAPVRNLPAAAYPSARCFVLQSQALALALPHIPARLRAPTRELQRAFIAYDQRQAATPPMDGICIVTTFGRRGSSANCGAALPEIRHGMLPSDDNGTFVGVVPDGVASVTLRIAPGAGHVARSVTAVVRNNMYVARAGQDVPFKPGSPTVVWRAADGRVLRTFSEPNPESLRELCQQHAEACVPAYLLAVSSTKSATSTAPLAARAAKPTKSGG
jgi:hypothetical protein